MVSCIMSLGNVKDFRSCRAGGVFAGGNPDVRVAALLKLFSCTIFKFRSNTFHSLIVLSRVCQETRRLSNGLISPTVCR